MLRAINFASATPTITMTAGLYAGAGELVIPGGLAETYTLSCERPNGTVLETRQVTVDRGRSARVDLKECLRRF